MCVTVHLPTPTIADPSPSPFGFCIIVPITRMHSSRMRPARFNGHLYWGGVVYPGRCVQGVCVQEAVCLGVCPWGCTPPRPRGRHPFAPLHVGIHSPPIACWDTHNPPVNRMTDRCKNITFPQTSFAASRYVQFQSDQLFGR